MMCFFRITDPSGTGCGDNGQTDVHSILLGSESGLEFSCSFNQCNFPTDVCVEYGFKGKDLREEGVKSQEDGLNREIIEGGDACAGLGGQ